MAYTSLRVLGFLLVLFGLTILPPLFISLYNHDGAALAFQQTITISFISGLVFSLLAGKKSRELRTRDGFVIVVLLWTVLSLFAALPFYLHHIDDFGLADAVFEAISGLTTTGSTVMDKIDGLPISMIYYRQQLQFLGGMGIILLAVAILPMLGIGGMQLFRAETTGPIKDNKLTPRITETAKALWYIYFTLTALCALSFWLTGMSAFDAICYSFSTVSTGGFAPHDASLAYYPQPMVQIFAIIFMLAGSISFSLHFAFIHQFNFNLYRRDSECKFYGLVLLGASVLIIVYLQRLGVFDDLSTTVLQTLFHVVSLTSTTGFTSSKFSAWPTFVPHLLLLLGVMGGCAGSTGGGIKVVRLLIMFKQGARELKRLVHPNGAFLVKVNQRAVPTRIIEAVWGFIAIYIILFLILSLLLLWTGLSFDTAMASIIASLANVGPGLADTATHFHNIPTAAKWILSAAMLIGRLEVFTILVLLTPTFWRS